MTSWCWTMNGSKCWLMDHSRRTREQKRSIGQLIGLIWESNKSNIDSAPRIGRNVSRCIPFRRQGPLKTANRMEPKSWVKWEIQFYCRSRFRQFINIVGIFGDLWSENGEVLFASLLSVRESLLDRHNGNAGLKWLASLIPWDISQSDHLIWIHFSRGTDVVLPFANDPFCWLYALWSHPDSIIRIRFHSLDLSLFL
jgi:hypothetical protein